VPHREQGASLSLRLMSGRQRGGAGDDDGGSTPGMSQTSVKRDAYVNRFGRLGWETERQVTPQSSRVGENGGGEERGGGGGGGTRRERRDGEEGGKKV